MASVFLAVPHYSTVVAGSLESLIQASRKHTIHLQTAGGSLLAYVFNILWCNALNKQPRPDYFAMHHSDIHAEPGWLDIMIDELEKRQADILSTVVPIKDNRGLTSTGYLDTRNDGRITRYTMKQIMAKDPSFTFSTDSNLTLLVNTGLMLVDFRKPWVEEFRFNIQDNIKRKPDGKFYPEVLPEDWNMSVWARERKLNVWATRKARVLHHGPAAFTNDKPWGEFDRDKE
jgi:hypothetical protein